MPHASWNDWPYVVAPFAIYLLSIWALFGWGDHGSETGLVRIFFRRISNSLERVTGRPGWSMAGALSGLLMLWVALVGLYWDVAFHIDLGRDKNLFTPSHTMIVLALGGLVYSAAVAVVFASVDGAPVGLRWGPLRIPWSALLLAGLGAGGVAAFPLDALWHNAFGVDVTLWSPTHLMLVAGGGLAPIAVWLMTIEGRAGAARAAGDTGRLRPTLLARGIDIVVCGAILTGLSAFQGEFDFGVPQFQVLYLPILVAVGAGLALCVARLSLGRGGALWAAASFVFLRGCVALILGPALHLTVPRFPLYLGAALAVEAAALLVGTDRRARFGALAGLLVGTVGLAAELPWVAVLGWIQVSSAGLAKAAVLSALAGVGAGLVGVALGRVVPGGRHVHPGLVGAALLALLVVLAVPLPRNVGRVDAVVRLRPVGERAEVQVDLSPADAARHATAFGVVSWQGGGRVGARLRQVAPGRYVSSRPVPVSGRWKSTVGLQRGDQVMAVPVYLPADPEIGAAGFPALPERHATFVRDTTLLLREAHGGPGWVAALSYAGLAFVVGGWLALFALCAARVGRDSDSGVLQPGALPDSHVARPPVPPDVRTRGPFGHHRGTVKIGN